MQLRATARAVCTRQRPRPSATHGEVFLKEERELGLGIMLPPPKKKNPGKVEWDEWVQKPWTLSLEDSRHFTFSRPGPCHKSTQFSMEKTMAISHMGQRPEAPPHADEASLPSQTEAIQSVCFRSQPTPKCPEDLVHKGQRHENSFDKHLLGTSVT